MANNKDVKRIYYAPDVFISTEEREKYLRDEGEIPKDAKVRSQKDDEIILEFDRKKKTHTAKKSREWTVPAIKETYKVLRKENIRAYVTDHNGHSPHIRIPNIKGLEKLSHEERKQYRLNFYERYVPEKLLNFVDTSFTDEFRWTSLEDRQHYKKGLGKEYKDYTEEKIKAGKTNINAENKIIDELLPKKPAAEKLPAVIDDAEKEEAEEENSNIGGIPCYNAILDNPNADWRARGFLVLFLKNYYKLKEPEVTEFIKRACKWSDYNEKKTAKHVTKYFTKGNKAELIKGYLTKKKLKKFNLCLDCGECFFEAANYKDDKDGQAERIIEGTEGMQLFHDQYNEPYARLEINGRFEIHPINSKFFKRWISKLYYDNNGKPPNSNSLSAALKVIEAEACFNGEKKELHNRVAWHEGAIWYDLTDKYWRAIRIDEKGWELVQDPPILFKRYSHQAAQVEPKDAREFSKISQYLNLKDAKDIQLFEVYSCSCLIPEIPKPIPTLHGPQGSAKSTALKVTRKLVDPSVIEVLGAPRDPKELVQMLSHHYCAYFDNLTAISGWLSDMFCKAVTGDGFSKRQLFTDDDDIIYNFKRCIGINGINVPATRPDLLDRAMLLGFERVSKDKRLTERKLWGSFDKDRPALLGSMFNVISDAMRIKAELQLQELPRMADFAEWGESISQALGYEPNSFINNYFGNVERQNEEAIQAHVIGPAIIELLKTGSFEGPASVLLERLEGIAECLKINTKAKEWPKAPHVLTRRLNELRSNLEEQNIILEIIHSGDRKIRIYNNTENASKASKASLNDGPITDEEDVTDALDANSINSTYQELIHHKCSICGSTPCVDYDARSRPVCLTCFKSLKANKEAT